MYVEKVGWDKRSAVPPCVFIFFKILSRWDRATLVPPYDLCGSCRLRLPINLTPMADSYDEHNEAFVFHAV